ncbi:roadblock/LC7 domain-containing protein [Streptomyces sp. NPDC087859]|uniref:roadblock/LC7 domain-containing protein n=1 Tax=Streptomyces sp. NPDC087859 TaxID=3365812 RepID=UPI003816BFCA
MLPHSEPTTTPDGTGEHRESMAWLLREFVNEVAGATHAVLASRDGVALLDSDIDRDWADELAAAVCGLASLGGSITGPRHEKHLPRQIIIERPDSLIFIQFAGRSTAFGSHNGIGQQFVDTVLCVVTTPEADAGTVGFEMGRLVTAFEPHMLTPARTLPADSTR